MAHGREKIKRIIAGLEILAYKPDAEVYAEHAKLCVGFPPGRQPVPAQDHLRTLYDNGWLWSEENSAWTIFV